MNNKLEEVWFGPDEETYNEGFNDLFSVPADYAIPPAPESAKKGNVMNVMGQGIQSELKKGMDSVMQNFFGQKKEEEIVNNNAVLNEQKPNLKVVSKPNFSANEVVVVEPRSFEDSLEIVSHLSKRKSVILNLQYIDNAVSQRVIDFVSGATHAFEGSQQRVGNGVFIFAPHNCTIETESDSDKAYRDIFAKTFGV